MPSNAWGAAGGSGIIIIKVLSTVSVTFSTGITKSKTTSGSYDIYSITATSTTNEKVVFA
jgi:hypothetical protein